MTANEAYSKRTDSLIKAFSSEVAKNPMVYPLFLCGIDFLHGPSHEIVISGKAGSGDVDEMIAKIRKPFLPNKIVLFRSDKNAVELAKVAAFTELQKSLNGAATAYVCQEFACQLPTTDLKKVIESLTGSPPN